jgi:V8-like Glu-specific endopeptidase
MVDLKSVANPPFSALEAATAPRSTTPGSLGIATSEQSRSARYLLAKGKSGPLLRRRTGLESVLGQDDRVRILDTELPPWRMICALEMRGPSGAGAIGTGWLVGPRTLLTAGHCVHSGRFFGGWAREIAVSPGRNGATFPFDTVRSTRFASLDAWVVREDPDFDIGCVHLDQPIGERLGWFAIGALPPNELEGCLVNVSGYPVDRGEGAEQYHHRNRVLRVSERRLFYDVDTYGGQSGAPVWIHESSNAPPLVVGIHAYGTSGTPPAFHIEANSAPRIIPEVLDRISAWVKEDGGWPRA